MTKTRYPARLFHLLQRYPVKHCEACGAQLTPKVREVKGKPALEAVKDFQRRRSCYTTCGGALRRKSKSALPEETSTGVRSSGTCEVHGDYLHGPRGCPSCAVAGKKRFSNFSPEGLAA